MIADSVSKRYAKALVNVAEDQAALETQIRQLQDVRASVEGNLRLKEYLANPAVSREHKKKVLTPVAERLGVSESLKHFLVLLVEKNRLQNLENIMRCHKELVDERLNRAQARVTAARPLDEGQRQQLLQKLSAITKKQISITEHTDPRLIGGLVVQIGGTIYDGSVKRQLALVREELLKE